MSNSPLVSYTRLSPNRTKPRNHVIDTVTIHCMAGNMSVETCGELFANAARKASSNYGIGSDGRIALYVDEADRSWCSSSASNDNRAVTIEVANNGGAPDWPVSSAAYESLIKLLADICQRNNIKQLLWRGDKSLIGKVNLQNMTVHRWFAAKACPGEYLYRRHGEIADRVNALLKRHIETSDREMRYYRTLPDVPDCYRATIRKLMEREYLVGYDEKDPAILEDNIIDVSEDVCRILVVLDRAGVFK